MNRYIRNRERHIRKDYITKKSILSDMVVSHELLMFSTLLDMILIMTVLFIFIKIVFSPLFIWDLTLPIFLISNILVGFLKYSSKIGRPSFRLLGLRYVDEIDGKLIGCGLTIGDLGEAIATNWKYNNSYETFFFFNSDLTQTKSMINQGVVVVPLKIHKLFKEDYVIDGVSTFRKLK